MKDTLFTLIIFATGIFMGITDTVPQWLHHPSLSLMVLMILVFMVGIELGVKEKETHLSRNISLRALMLPLFTITGTLLFSALAVVVLSDMSINDCLAVGSGFGYYSLSSVLIANLKSASFGTDIAIRLSSIALLANIIREMLALFSIPFLAKHFGKFVPISVAGISSMDLCLPMIVKKTGREELIPVAVIHGVALEISVPLLVTFFCR